MPSCPPESIWNPFTIFQSHLLSHSIFSTTFAWSSTPLPPLILSSKHLNHNPAHISSYCTGSLLQILLKLHSLSQNLLSGPFLCFLHFLMLSQVELIHLCILLCPSDALEGNRNIIHWLLAPTSWSSPNSLWTRCWPWGSPRRFWSIWEPGLCFSSVQLHSEICSDSITHLPVPLFCISGLNNINKSPKINTILKQVLSFPFSLSFLLSCRPYTASEGLDTWSGGTVIIQHATSMISGCSSLNPWHSGLILWHSSYVSWSSI